MTLSAFSNMIGKITGDPDQLVTLYYFDSDLEDVTLREPQIQIQIFLSDSDLGLPAIS